MCFASKISGCESATLRVNNSRAVSLPFYRSFSLLGGLWSGWLGVWCKMRGGDSAQPMTWPKPRFRVLFI